MNKLIENLEFDLRVFERSLEVLTNSKRTDKQALEKVEEYKERIHGLKKGISILKLHESETEGIEEDFEYLDNKR